MIQDRSRLNHSNRHLIEFLSAGIRSIKTVAREIEAG